tara:strand:+ start:8317 stop:8571 length:255 start_codon:yes stop_codon:yes gene_type:complete
MPETKLRWAEFLVFIDNKNYATGYRDDEQPHEDYEKGIYVSIPTRIPVRTDTIFEYGGHKMKALVVTKCSNFDDHFRVFCREIK